MSSGFLFCEITYSDSLQVLVIQKAGENTLFGFLSLMTHLVPPESFTGSPGNPTL